MTYRSDVTAADLLCVLRTIPPDTVVDIAGDPECNLAGPLAMRATGGLDAVEMKLREGGRPVLVLLPLHMQCFEDRYLDEE